MSSAVLPATSTPAWVKIVSVLIAIPTALATLAFAVAAIASLDSVSADRDLHTSLPIDSGGEVDFRLNDAAVNVVAGPDGEVSVDDHVNIEALTHDLARRGLAAIAPAQLAPSASGVAVTDHGTVLPYVTRFNHRLTVRVPAGARIVLRSTNGAAQLSGISAPVDVEVTNGALNMTGVTVAGTDRVIATNGAINIEGAMAGGSLDLTSQNGAIHVRLPSSTSAQYDLASLTGAVVVMDPSGVHAAAGLTHSLTGRIGAGDMGVIRARTANGAIAVEAR